MTERKGSFTTERTGSFFSRGLMLGRVPAFAAPAANAVSFAAPRTTRAIGAGALAIALAALIAWTLPAISSAPAGPDASQSATHARSLTSLPLAAQGPVASTLGAHDPAYRIRGLSAVNPAQRLHASFGTSGVTIASHGGTVRLSLAGFGRSGKLTPVRPVSPSVDRNRVTYRHGEGLEEWYANGPLGLEQGFEIERAPHGENAPLKLSLALRGDLSTRLHDGVLRLEGHGADLRYGGLLATDANGRRLPASLSLAGGRLTISVADRGAAYPLRIDPFVQQAELSASDAREGEALGESVAISADGDTIVAGAPFRNGPNEESEAAIGAVFVFTKPGGGWTNATQSAELTVSGAEGGESLGYSVAVSADGSTIASGAIGHAIFAGAAYVFVRPGSGWTNATQTAELTASDAGETDHFGSSIAISPDGGTVVAGSPSHTTSAATNAGAAYVFVRPGSGWANATQTAELTASDAGAFESFGSSVAISPDDGTIFAGAGAHTVGENNSQGAVYVFAKPGGGWANGTQTTELTAPDGAGGDGLGTSLAAGEGAIVAGAPGHTVGSTIFTNQGAAYVFVEPVGGWGPAPRVVELTLTEGEPGGGFGRSVAISGHTVLVGAPGESYGPNIYQGIIYAAQFASDWSATTASQQLTSADGQDYDGFGGAVASAGGTLVAGSNNHQVGAVRHAGDVYVFGEASSPGGGGDAGQGGPGGGGTHQQGGGATGKVKIGALKVSGSHAEIRLNCAAGASPCALQLRLTVSMSAGAAKLASAHAVAHHKHHKHHKKHSGAVLVGQAKVTLAAGKSKLVAIGLDRSGKTLLARKRRLSAKLTITENGKTVGSRRITFKAKGKRRGKHGSPRKH